MTKVQPILFTGVETLSFRQIDELNGLLKGTSFKLFKTHLAALVEGTHYFHICGSAQPLFLAELKRTQQVYLSSVHLVLITREGYQLLQNLSKSVGAIQKTWTGSAV